jgi:Flp pilus assembly pilin Flp
MELYQVGAWMKAKLASKLANRRGQNTVEYLLMLTVVVGVVLVAGVALKKFMPTLFNNIQQMITGAASQMGSGGN